MLLAILGSAAIAFESLSVASYDCDADAEQILALDFTQFDQDFSAGWRALEAQGCRETAISMLRLYREKSNSLSAGQRSILLWHEGQLTAMQGRYSAAIPLLLGGVPLNDKGDFTEYALGTVAFLKRDRNALISARDRLAQLPEPEGWENSFPVDVNGKRVIIENPWPPNLAVLNRLIACFDLDYEAAYTCDKQQ